MTPELRFDLGNSPLTLFLFRNADSEHRSLKHEPGRRHFRHILGKCASIHLIPTLT